MIDDIILFDIGKKEEDRKVLSTILSLFKDDNHEVGEKEIKEILNSYLSVLFKNKIIYEC
ncbi:MAG: hypothetical protein K6348_08450 [Deferribacterales bacterium]